MTDRCLQLYSSNRVYYNLERGSEIDNPDQVSLIRKIDLFICNDINGIY